MITPRYLTTFEHALIGVGDGASDISPTEAEVLALLGTSRPGFCDRRFSAIRLAQFCGIVNLGNRLIEILPKVGFDPEPERVGRARLISLLSESGSISISEHAASSQSMARHTLLEVFIGAFLDRVIELARGGLRKDYVAFSEDLTVVRGRVDLQRQMTVLADRPDIIGCHYDDLTIDAPWNRAIKSALRVVRPWIVSDDLRRRWIDSASVFDEVRDVAMDAESVERLSVDRKATRYRDVRRWVIAILRLLSPSLRAGYYEAPSLLFDMNSVFQACVTRWLWRHCLHMPEVLITAEDKSHHFAKEDFEGGAVVYNIRPDIVFRRRGQVIAIADTKWKRLGGEKGAVPELSDLYQLFGYAGAFECGSLCLVYPWHSSVGSDTNFALRLPTMGDIHPRIKVVLVDVEKRTFFGSVLDSRTSDDWSA